jgi:signal peptidase I
MVYTGLGKIERQGRRMRAEADVKKSGERSGFIDTLRVVAQALLIALVIRVFFYQPFNIPSGSMIPTLLVGDYLFVSKFSYGYSKYSFPLGFDLFEGRVWSAEPKRGDVVVFKLPRDNETDYIKRLIGLPGDHIQMINGVLNINGKPVERHRVKDFDLEMPSGSTERVAQYEETLPNGVTYDTLDLVDGGFADDTPVFIVPEGHYFMMGDNRDNSTDSRFQRSNGVGYVPRENLVGRAEIIFFSIDEKASLFTPWRWPMDIRWSRIFTSLRS